MSKFFDETLQGLLEAVAIKKSEMIHLKEQNEQAKIINEEDVEKKSTDNVKLYEKSPS